MLAKYHQPSPYSGSEMDLNAKIEPQNPRACDTDTHAQAGGIA